VYTEHLMDRMQWYHREVGHVDIEKLSMDVNQIMELHGALPTQERNLSKYLFFHPQRARQCLSGPRVLMAEMAEKGAFESEGAAADTKPEDARGWPRRI